MLFRLNHDSRNERITQMKNDPWPEYQVFIRENHCSVIIFFHHANHRFRLSFSSLLTREFCLFRYLPV